MYAKMGITVFISLYTTRLVLDALGASDFGIFNVVGGAIAMLTFLNNAMTGATQRFMSYSQGEGYKEKQKIIFNISIILHFITALIVVLLLELAGFYLFKDLLTIPIERIHAAKLIFHFLVISTFFTIASVPYDAVINAHENMLLVAILGVLEAILKLGIAFFITYTDSDKLVVYGFLMAILSILLLVAKLIYCQIKYEEVDLNIIKYYDGSLAKEMTSFAGWSFLGATTSMLGFYGQGIVLNMFFGPIVNAAQGIASQVGGQLTSFSGTMLKALNPTIAKSEGSGDRDLMYKATFMGSKIAYFLLMILSIPVILEMPIIFDFWLEEVPEYAVIFCRLLLIKLLVDQININLTTLIAAVGKIKNYQITVSVVYVLPLIFAIIVFRIGFPPYWIYIVFLFFSIVAGIANIYYSKEVANLPIDGFLKNVILRIVLASFLTIGISALPILFLNQGIIRVIIVFSISLCSSFLILWYVGFSKLEKENIYGFLVSIKTNLLQKAKPFPNNK